MALVIAIRGECKEWLTPATQLLPTQQDNANVDIIELFGTIDAKPSAVVVPADAIMADFM